MIDERLSGLINRAFDYRGYVTLRRRDGSTLAGYVYNRGPSHLDVLDHTATQRLQVPLAEIADIDFTGEDAARKSQESWERRKGTLESRETSAWGEWHDSGPVLVLVALDLELRSVARALEVTARERRAQVRVPGGEVVARAIGIGGGSRAVVQKERPRLVVTCGFSGALDAGLAPGDLVLATRVRDETGDVISAPEPQRRAAAAALREMRVVEGELGCVTTLACTPNEKRALARHGSVAVDMESHPAARAATELGIPWLGIRAIVDSLEASLPAFTREAPESHVLGALKHALTGPRALMDLVQLSSAARRAADALEEAIRRLVPALVAAEAHP
jgi:nucleoside phosphorylase